MPRPNLEAAALDCINEAIHGMGTLDLDALRDNADEQTNSAAESVTIYYSDCLDIISRYESEADDSTVDDLTGGKTYTAGEWREAMTAYAFGVAYSVLSHEVSEILQAIDTAADDLATAATAHGFSDDDQPRISTDCPHGWAAHDREDEAGTHFWTEGNLEGCRAVAVKVAGIWLSYTWTPEPAEEEGAE
jgi:hypothetical protein